MIETLEKRFAAAIPAADYGSIRFMRERNERISVRQNVLQPISVNDDAGAMVTVHKNGGIGYAATSDLSDAGLRAAARAALDWADRTAARAVTDFSKLPRARASGDYASPVAKPWADTPLKVKIDLLKRESERLKAHETIVDWEARLWNSEIESLIVDTEGSRIVQRTSILVPDLRATANRGTETQTRTFGGFRAGRQGGLEVLDGLGFYSAAPRVAAEAVQLLDAPNCPTGEFDLLLAPDQMILQIHESIGHPLELDRILGDERNYAGTSFVTLDMFGTYRYGSPLLNILFDPTVGGEMASYGFDDEGLPARREYIIKEGILLRPLGGRISQARAGVEGVANSRACSWNRPPIDRMANLNLEPGTTPFDKMVAQIERGVYMQSNCSWSIDDSRNKFQFGCEVGHLVENGRITKMVKNPNYRGISATFWRSLKAVGTPDTFEVLGTPYCGKGEPNQSIRVGHASPAALFSNVQVFGGA
jgi:predicted Zn-dependent protease